jgi:hypothetical protein
MVRIRLFEARLHGKLADPGSGCGQEVAQLRWGKVDIIAAERFRL